MSSNSDTSTTAAAGPVLSEGLGPGGCQCYHCGCIFIGGPGDSICEGCFAAYKESMRQEAQRAEWHAEMWRDVFGA